MSEKNVQGIDHQELIEIFKASVLLSFVAASNGHQYNIKELENELLRRLNLLNEYQWAFKELMDITSLLNPAFLDKSPVEAARLFDFIARHKASESKRVADKAKKEE